MGDVDLLFVGGKVRPFADRDDGADALAVRDGRIAAVGRAAELSALAAARTVDLRGRVLAPGLIDAHNHLSLFSLIRRYVDCRVPLGGSVDELLSRVARRAEGSPKGAWVRGWGFAHYRVRERRFPTLAELDSATPDHPVAILHVSAHTVQVNSAALRALGLGDATPDPAGGRLDRDPETGRLNGLLHEKAMQRFSIAAMMKELAALPQAEQVAAIEQGAAEFAALGLTTSCDALATPELLAAVQAADRLGRLPCNVVAMPHYDVSGALIERGPAPAGAGRVRIGAIKLFADGSLSGCTAAVSEPYRCSHSTGILYRAQDETDAIVQKLHERGFQIAVHAIGDRAIAQVAAAYERAIGRGRPNERRHRLEHVGVLNPSLIEALARVDAVVATQPRMLFEQGDGFLRSCGEERMRWIYPYRALIEAGLHVAGSSDCPVVSADPLLGMRDAVLRRTEEGVVVSPDQRLTPAQALRMWTREAAYSVFQESERGTLEVGRAADLVVLSGDPLSTPAETWGDAVRVEMTVVGGEIVFDRAYGSVGV